MATGKGEQSDSLRSVWQDLKKEIKLQATILFGFVALIWALEVVDLVIFGGGLDRFGIRPRSLVGLRGIPLAPFLHGGFGHLAANTGGLIMLGWFVMLRRTAHFFVVGAICTVVGGIGVWLIGASSSTHIGSSIVIFGFLGYLLLRGFFDRRWLVMAGSVAVGLLYGGALFGLLPGQPGVSWEGHLFGFLGGVLSARLLRAGK
jgi:membrane associated rhomboid family serine protease